METSSDVAVTSDWTVEPSSVALGAFLSMFALVTIFGNCLVILAVLRERHLRSSTNYLIVSLAVADLVIGAVVMPFAISLEVLQQRWLFGRDWCDVWHSFDVLASTASILNLSIIALDRYLAITNAIKYPQRMTTHRIMLLISLVWVLSAAISFPAILWWRHSSQPPTFTVTSPATPATNNTTNQQSEAVTSLDILWDVNNTSSPASHHPVTSYTTCVFTEDPYYLVISSIVSFYAPVAFILYAYYCIYTAASAQTRSIKTGSKTLTNCSNNDASDDCRSTALTLRIHRGGARAGRHGGARVNSLRRKRNTSAHSRTRSAADANDLNMIEDDVSDCEFAQPCLVTSAANGHHDVTTARFTRRSASPSRLHPAMTSAHRAYHVISNRSPQHSPAPSPRTTSRGWQQKFAISKRLGKIAKERKAAKTLGIVMGVFCVCWVPFFITNLLYALCKSSCVVYPDVLFPIFTWLGYINSGMNPVIYACSMRDFRRAFHKLLCRSCPSHRRRAAACNGFSTPKSARLSHNGKSVRFHDVTSRRQRYVSDMTSATTSDVTNGFYQINGTDSS